MCESERTNIVYSFFRKNEKIFTSVALFLTLLGLTLDINERTKNDAIIYCSLILFVLIVILITIILFDAFHTAFEKSNNPTLIEIIHKGVLLLVSFLLIDILLLLLLYFVEKYPSHVPIVEIVFFYAILLISPLAIIYIFNKINDMNGAMTGFTISLIVLAIAWFFFKQMSNFIIQKIPISEGIPLSDFMGLAIFVSIISTASVSTLFFLYNAWILREK